MPPLFSQRAVFMGSGIGSTANSVLGSYTPLNGGTFPFHSSMTPGLSNYALVYYKLGTAEGFEYAAATTTVIGADVINSNDVATTSVNLANSLNIERKEL